MSQLALLPPWWSEIRRERIGVAGDRELARYRCARCDTWSAPQDAKKAAAGACRFCVPLPLPLVDAPPGPVAALAPPTEPVRALEETEGILRPEKATRRVSTCTCDLRDRKWNPATSRCETCGCKFIMSELERAAEALELHGLPARGCTAVELQLEDGTTVSGIACTRGKPPRVHLASPTGTACGRRGGSVPMPQQTRDRDQVTCKACLRRAS